MIKKIFFFGLFVFAFVHATHAQEYYRFKADFSIKEKFVGDEKGQLITGTVYFDKNTHKVYHDIRFPAREKWLNHDTTMYKIVADTLASKRTILPFGEMSVYNMILSQQLNDFGLNSGGYDLTSVEEGANGQTTSIWNPKKELKALLGKVVLMQEQKRVTGVAMYTTTDELAAKFYFKDYQLIEDLPVPGKIYQVFYIKEKTNEKDVSERKEKEFNRIITYKNIVINQQDEDEIYDFKLPDLK
jgi:hypothetical protein